jgi:ketosteroid isomerase-like protein
MSSTTGTRAARTVLDDTTVERLGTALDRCFVTLEAPADAFADDVFFDSLPPMWRFQMQGRENLEAQLRATAGEHTTTRVLRVVPTADGFVLEQEIAEGDVDLLTARRLFLCAVRDGRISEVLEYCNGPWDDELRARHAAEAPMLRP